MEDGRDLGFDLAAASLRADEGELTRAIETFATKLERALPSACRVKRRRRGPLSRESQVRSVDVDLGDSSFHLRWSRHRLVAVRTKQVHDMSRRTETLALADWLHSLEVALRERAAASAEGRAALEELLEG